MQIEPTLYALIIHFQIRKAVGATWISATIYTNQFFITNIIFTTAFSSTSFVEERQRVYETSKIT